MVFETTYLVAVLTPGHSSVCFGQKGAQISKVLRPNNRSNGMLICLFMTVPITSSEYGACHPPYAKPPLVSSSGPPPACMTPSRDMNSSTITFLMTVFLQHLVLMTCLYSTDFDVKKLLVSCSNPQPDTCLGLKTRARSCNPCERGLFCITIDL